MSQADGDLLRWTGEGWEVLPINGVRVDAGPNGEPWIVNAAGEVHSSPDGYKWTLQSAEGTAADIGVGTSGLVYIIGTTKANEFGDGSSNSVLRWNGAGFDLLGNIGGIRISVQPNGQPMVIVAEAQNFYFLYENGNLGMCSPKQWGTDLHMGPVGDLWFIGGDRRVWNCYDWTNQDAHFERDYGSGDEIAIDGGDHVYVINGDSTVWGKTKNNYTAWEQYTIPADYRYGYDIGAGGKSLYAVVSTNP